MQEPMRTSPFDVIRHTAEDGSDFWSARELYKTLGYNEWRNFRNVVMKRAMKACEENGRAVADHFVQSYKAIIVTGRGDAVLTLQSDHRGHPPDWLRSDHRARVSQHPRD